MPAGGLFYPVFPAAIIGKRDRRLRPPYFLSLLVMWGALAGWPLSSDLLRAESQSGSTETVRYLLTSAVMCEGIQGDIPINPAAVFSVRNGNVYCWSAFDQIAKRETIYHYWYRKDTLVASIKLVLQPPRWASYSNIRLRDADKGPWRVDIADSDHHVMKTLRFSISD
jgi:hypothetical protein